MTDDGSTTMDSTTSQMDVTAVKPYGAIATEAAADPARWEIWPAPAGHRETLYQRFPEFTCLCPRSGYPDFATVHLVIVPELCRYQP